MTYKKLIVLTVALLTGSAAFSQIHKMERKDSSAVHRTYNLNPVVVTGSGHHQRLKSTATPVRVLSSQEIHEQGITTFDGALTRMMPQASMAPSSMGSFLRLNGLGNKYILILINGQKLSGDISNNVDLNRINMSRVKRIEVLDGAASSLYGSDAIEYTVWNECFGWCYQYHYRSANTRFHQCYIRYPCLWTWSADGIGRTGYL